MNRGYITRGILLMVALVLTFCCSSNVKDCLFPGATAGQVPTISKSRLTVDVSLKDFKKALKKLDFIDLSSHKSYVILSSDNSKADFMSFIGDYDMIEILCDEYEGFAWDADAGELKLPLLDKDSDYVQVPACVMMSLVEKGYFLDGK